MLQLTETDEAGNVVATYVQTSTAKRDVTRMDRIVTTSHQIDPNYTLTFVTGARKLSEIAQDTSRYFPAIRISSQCDGRLFAVCRSSRQGRGYSVDFEHYRYQIYVSTQIPYDRNEIALI